MLAGDEHRHTYAAMITELDTQVGRIVDALKQKGMLENTLIIFTQRQWRRDQRAVRDGSALAGGT